VTSGASTPPADPEKDSDTEGAELYDMRRLPNAGMQMAQEIGRGAGKKPTKDGQDYPAGLIRREVVGGKNGNRNADEDCRYPKSKTFLQLEK
jgi:hypothetical protein